MTIGARRSGILKTKIRRWVFNTIDGFYVVPGRMAKDTLYRWHVKPRPFIYLPNLVDDERFEQRNVRSFKSAGPRRILIVARLEEEYKGIMNFMTAVGNSVLEKVCLIIVGAGGSESLYRDFISTNRLHDYIFLIGNRSADEVSQEYDLADIFVLPSYSDPSPLAVVEALKKGLPLFISNRCGNHFEAVEDGGNGYLFDPTDHEQIRRKFQVMLAEPERLERFSRRSIELAKKNFDTKRVLRTAFSVLLDHAK